MSTPADTIPLPKRAVSGFWFRHPKLRLSALIVTPLFWLGVVYLGSLAVLLASAFWTVDSFSGVVDRTPTLANFQAAYTDPFYLKVAGRTILVAALVTAADAVIAFPIAFFMAKVASRRWQRVLVVAVLMPLWASYLVKAFAWRTLLKPGGIIESAFGWTPGFSTTSAAIVLGYLWLPYMILPIYAGLERLPNSLLEASADLGGRTWRTMRSVVLPLAFPSIVAGSIFTFSLTLGDYIAVSFVGGPNQFLGNLIYDKLGSANDLPLAAALATIPALMMIIYLVAVRRTGALREL